MTEEKKKPGTINRIFGWIGLGLLVALILGALIYDAPWKALALLLILLAVHTILPKAAKKWFWLSVCGVLMGLLVWVFLPDRNDIWRPYTFDDELAAHEAKYAIPDEENAATIYNKLLSDFNPTEWRLRFLSGETLKLTLSEPWLSQDYPELTQWLSRNEEKITALPEACKIKKCRFPSNIKLARTDKLEIDRYSALRSWSAWFLLSANNDIAKGRPDSAVSKYIYALQIADHLHQQQRITDFLIGFGIENPVIPSLNRFVVEDKPTQQQLQFISNSLRNLDNNWRCDFLACVEYEKLFIKNTFCGLAYQINPQGQVRLSRDPAAAIWGYSRKRALAETYWQRESMKAFTILAWFFLPATPEKAGEMIDEIYEKCLAMAEPDFAWDKEDIISMPSLELNCRFLVMSQTNKLTRHNGRFHDIYLRRLAMRRGTQLLVAIKRHSIENGCWPSSLDAIKSDAPAESFIDPVTGKEFKYETHGERFLLYGETVNVWPK